MKYFSNPQDAVLGNQLTLVFEGENIFRSILEALQGAKHRIFISMYDFAADKSGEIILRALVDAAKRGCEVKIVYDAVGSIFTRPIFFEPLVRAGGEVRSYHEVWPPRMNWKFIKRNHRKIICIDSAHAMLGGFNFSDPYFLPGRQGYFDLMVKISGAASSQAFQLFEQAWNKSSYQPLFAAKQWIEKRKANRSKVSGDNFVQVIGNDHFSERWKIRREILHVLNRATESINIINPYFLPDPAILKSLIAASKRGVRIKILTPDHTDVKLIDLASMVAFKRLMKYGIEVFRWPGFIHAKSISVDGKWASVGSYNLDYRSLFHNLEAVVHVLDQDFTTSLTRMFDSEIANSARMDLADWEKMSLVSKSFAHIIYRFRALL